VTLQLVLQVPSIGGKGPRPSALQRNLLSLDNHRRAVLTIAALTHLVGMKREISPSDASGLVTFEILERIVINGSIEDRDEVLKRFETHESFEWFLAAEVV
jgi:hypothetical protein